MNVIAENSEFSRFGAGAMSAQDVKSLLRALGQWGVAEEAGVTGDALNDYAVRAQDAFMKVAQAA